jgi:hypothetical protein
MPAWKKQVEHPSDHEDISATSRDVVLCCVIMVEREVVPLCPRRHAYDSRPAVYTARCLGGRAGRAVWGHDDDLAYHDVDIMSCCVIVMFFQCSRPLCPHRHPSISLSAA